MKHLVEEKEGRILIDHIDVLSHIEQIEKDNLYQRQQVQFLKTLTEEYRNIIKELLETIKFVGGKISDEIIQKLEK